MGDATFQPALMGEGNAAFYIGGTSKNAL